MTRVVRQWEMLAREGADVEKQVGWVFKQPSLAKCVPTHIRGRGLDDL